MQQKDINEITEKILSLNDDPNKIHEFLCACANAKAIIENKLHADTFKIACKASMTALIKQLGK